MDKKARLTILANKLAEVLEQDITKHGDLKPSYMSPKFWAHIEIAMKTRQSMREGKKKD